MIDFKRLIQAGVHFGHQRARWNPKMAPYIWGYSNDVHLINVAKTAQQLEKASQFLESVAAQGKTVLWVGTKKAAQSIIHHIAQDVECPFVTHRWIGGTLTNYSQVKKSITKLLHYEDILSKTEQSHYTKKEMVVFQKLVNRLQENVGGIRNFAWPVGAVIIVDVRKEQAALKEAASMGIPVVAIVDSNGDPSNVDYVIPGNDDAPKSIEIILHYLAQAVKKGKERAAVTEQQAAENLDVPAEMTVEHILATDEEANESDDAKRSKAKKIKDGMRQRSDTSRRPNDMRKR